MRHQHTIARTCAVRGRGYWTGSPVHVTIHPAAADSGVRLVRSDLPGHPECPATTEFRCDAALRTNLQCGDAKFEMIEHLMAALSALQIDNARVEIDSLELPGLDGSSLAYVEALSASGLIVQASRRQRWTVDGTYRVGDGNAWIQISPPTTSKSRLEYRLSYDDDTPIAPQAFALEMSPSSFIRNVAAARTFVTAKQADKIRAAGVALHVNDSDLIVIDDTGLPRAGKFRFNNECARHKTLDLIGDLSLSGVEFHGNVVSYRGGHVLNGRMASQLTTLAYGESIAYKPISIPFPTAIPQTKAA